MIASAKWFNATDTRDTNITFYKSMSNNKQQ